MTTCSGLIATSSRQKADAHDRLDDLDARVQPLEILRFVGGAEDVRVGRVRLLSAHLVRQPGLPHVLGHLRASAQLVDERLIEPRLVDPQAGIGEQAVAVEALDVVALERAAVAPDVDVVLLHRDDEHRAGDRAADRRGVEVGNAGGRDVERPALQHREPFRHQLRAAVDEPRLLGAVLQCAARDVVVVGFVRLTEVGGVGVRNRALGPHPVKGGARVEAAGKRDADPLARRHALKNVRHLLEHYNPSVPHVTVPILDIVAVTPRTRLVTLDLRGEPMRFLPGQAVMIGAHGGTTRKAVLDRVLARARRRNGTPASC